jgi:lipopolysaccharide/colanic/teichoic acid biosynthesis glycosyltransferase
MSTQLSSGLIPLGKYFQMLEPDTEVPCGTGSLDYRLLRVADFLIATMLIAFTLPLMIFVCAAIKLDSFGPALYRTLRTGPSGRFQMLRFRTTLHDPERGSRAIWDRGATETRIGAFLERTGIAELPQLVNVWRGEMTLVGQFPRARKFVRWVAWAIAALASGALLKSAGELVEFLV